MEQKHQLEEHGFHVELFKDASENVIGWAAVKGSVQILPFEKEMKAFVINDNNKIEAVGAKNMDDYIQLSKLING